MKHLPDEIEDCPKCSGSGELQPDIQCKSCEGTGIKNFDPSESARREEYLDRLFSLSDKILVADGVEHEKEIENQVAAMSYDFIQSQSAELKEKEKRIAKLEKGLRDSIKLISSLEYAGEPVSENNYKEFESILNKTN